MAKGKQGLIAGILGFAKGNNTAVKGPQRSQKATPARQPVQLDKRSERTPTKPSAKKTVQPTPKKAVKTVKRATEKTIKTVKPIAKKTAKTIKPAAKKAAKTVKPAAKKAVPKATKPTAKKPVKASKPSSKKTAKSGARTGGKKSPVRQVVLTPAAKRAAKQAAARARKEAQRQAAKAKRERLRAAAQAKRERLKAREQAVREAAKRRATLERERAAARAVREAARVALAETKRQERDARVAARAAERAAKLAARAAERQARLDARETARRARLGLPAIVTGVDGATVNEDGSPVIDFATAINSLVASATAGRVPLSDVEAMIADLEKSQVEEIPDIAAVLTALAERGIEVDDEIEESELREATEKAVRIVSSYAGEGDLDAFQQWRRDALSHPILTRAEETELTTRYLLYAKTAKALEAARERLEEQVAPLREALLDPESDETYRSALRPEIARIEEEQKVMSGEIERARALAENAENEFISFNFRLVVAIANRKFKQAGRKGEFMDLVQEGNRGMVEAFRRFDPTKGWKFSTFASWHIQQAISLWLYEQVGVLRVPTHRWRDARDIDKIRMEFQQRGETATLEQIAERMGKTPKKIQEILAAQTLTRTGSLDKPANDEDGSATIGELVGDEKALNPADVAVSEALKTIFADAFERVLDGRERRVLQLRYGMYDQEKKTLDWIGRRMNITRERVRQIEERALAKLRKDREVRAAGDGRIARDMIGEA